MEEQKEKDLIDDDKENKEKNDENNNELNIDEEADKIIGDLEEFEEQLPLISEDEKKEKKDLLKIFKRLEEDLESDDLETLNEIYGQYINNEDITKRNIKQDTSRKSLFLMFYVISPLFGIVNLIGIFESISIMNIIFQILKNSALNYIYSKFYSNEVERYSVNDFHKNYNFYNMFLDNANKESFDFNLMMFTAFIGDILLKSRGFRISTFAFGLINGLSILIMSFSFNEFEIKDNTYTFFQMLFLLLVWILLFIGVGASALLSQQIIIDSNVKYNKYLIKLNEESEKEWLRKKKIWEEKKKEKEKQKKLERNKRDLEKNNNNNQELLEVIKEEGEKEDNNENEKKEEDNENINKNGENKDTKIIIDNIDDESNIKKIKSGKIELKEYNENEKRERNERDFIEIYNNIKEIKKSKIELKKAQTLSLRENNNNLKKKRRKKRQK